MAAALAALVTRPRAEHVAADFDFTDVTQGLEVVLQPKGSYHLRSVSASFAADSHVELGGQRPPVTRGSEAGIPGSELDLVAKEVAERIKKLLHRSGMRDLSSLQVAARAIVQAGAADTRSARIWLTIGVLQGISVGSHVEVRIQVQRHIAHALGPPLRFPF